jgi:hypothetical protein
MKDTAMWFEFKEKDGCKLAFWFRDKGYVRIELNDIDDRGWYFWSEKIVDGHIEWMFEGLASMLSDDAKHYAERIVGLLAFA